MQSARAIDVTVPVRLAVAAARPVSFAVAAPVSVPASVREAAPLARVTPGLIAYRRQREELAKAEAARARAEAARVAAEAKATVFQYD